MKRAEVALVVAMAIALAGCVLHGKQQTAKNTPPAPKPAAEAAPLRNLSTPQTNVELPPSQPVNPEALAAPQPPEEPPPSPPPAAAHSGRPRSGTPTQHTEAPGPAAPPATQPATPETEQPRPPIQEIVPAADQKRLQDEAASCQKEIQQRLESIQGRALNHRERQTVTYIESFLKQSEAAEGRGDWRAAAELAERGLALARELTSGK